MSNWRIEEASIGKPSESSFIIVCPSSRVRDLAKCCDALNSRHLKRIHIVFDKRIPPLEVRLYLKIIKTVIPGITYIIKHTDARTIALMGYLWRQMQAFCERRKTREKGS